MLKGYCRAGGSGTSAPRGQMNAVVMAQPHQRLRFLMGQREHDGLRQHLALAIVIAIHPAIRGLDQQPIAPKNTVQLADKFRA